MMIVPRLKCLLQKCLIGAVFLGTVLSASAQTLSLSATSPDTYVVKQGDTLWDISTTFLDEPWRWPEIWQQNPNVADPDLIYPGDVLNLVYIDGNPRIVMERGSRQAVRLSPQVRESPLLSPIPVIPRAAIDGFLARNRIVDKETFESAPYILSSLSGNLLMGAGHELYAKGEWTAGVSQYEVFRLGASYVDKETKDLLGQEVINLGSLRIVSDEGDDLKKALVLSSKEELKAGDRLLPLEASAIDSRFFPTTPEQGLSGEIIGLLDNKSKAAQFESIVFNIGEAEGLRVGDILTIEKSGALVRDPITNKWVSLPTNEIGIVLTYKTFAKLSYGVILSLTEPASAGDILSTP
ncbi:MAG: LysM peptidoglycan-binding domain-containing protein [Gammaproteobacteria bacterium]